jgi:hypothetical protein
MTAIHTPLNFPAGSDIGRLANIVSGCPGLLSQVGATTKSLRGVARLSELVRTWPHSTTAIGACGPDEGLEVHAAAEPKGETVAGGLRPSEIGIGAIHSQKLQATVATRLPASLLRRLEMPPSAVFEASVGTLIDGGVLAEMPAITPYGQVDVLLYEQSRNLVAEVKSRGAGGQPVAWWIVDDGRLHAKSVRYFERRWPPAWRGTIRATGGCC